MPGRGGPYQWPAKLDEQPAVKMSQSLDPLFTHQDLRDTSNVRANSGHGSGRGSGRGSRKPYDYNPTPGNFASLPRRNSQSNDDVPRGSKPYSSARYPSTNQVKQAQPVPTRKMSRNASFHGMGDRERGIIVSPLDRNPAALSEETEDDSYLYRKASVDESFSNYENVSRKVSEEYPNYQNVSMGGIGSPVAPLPLPRRTHGVILEDPSTAPSTKWDIGAVNCTFPRRVPSRTNSMHVPREGSVTLPANSVPPEFKQRSYSLRRRASLHGVADMSPPSVRGQYQVADAPLPSAPGHRGQYNMADTPLPPAPGNRSYHSVSHMQLAPIGGGPGGSDRQGVAAYTRKHRRAQSHDISRAGLEESAELSQHRRVSEFFPREHRGEEEVEERVGQEEPVRVADTVTVYSPGASGGGQDLNQQVCYTSRHDSNVPAQVPRAGNTTSMLACSYIVILKV